MKKLKLENLVRLSLLNAQNVASVTRRVFFITVVVASSPIVSENVECLHVYPARLKIDLGD